MSLGRKLLSGFGAMLAPVLLQSGGALIVTHDLNNDLKRAAGVTARKQYLAGEVNAATSAMASYERGTVLSNMLSDKIHGDEYQQRFRACAAGLQKALAGLRGIAENSETSFLAQTLDRQVALECCKTTKSCSGTWSTSSWMQPWPRSARKFSPCWRKSVNRRPRWWTNKIANWR
jgi:hypothetical protein